MIEPGRHPDWIAPDAAAQAEALLARQGLRPLEVGQTVTEGHVHEPTADTVGLRGQAVTPLGFSALQLAAGSEALVGNAQG